MIVFNNPFNLLKFRCIHVIEPKPRRLSCWKNLFIFIWFNSISYGYSAIFFNGLRRNDLIHMSIPPSNLAFTVFSKSLKAFSIGTSANSLRSVTFKDCLPQTLIDSKGLKSISIFILSP